MRELSSGRTFVAGAAGSVDSCDEYGFWLAVAGTRALWAGWEPANHPLGTVQTDGGIGQRPRTLEILTSDYSAVGDVLVDVVGDRQTLAYATDVVAPNDWEDCFPENSAPLASCRFRVTAGAVKRVAGGKAVLVPRLPPLSAIAVSGSRLAVVPADRRWKRPSTRLHARWGGPVDVRDAVTGDLVWRANPRGEVKAVALTATLLAVLTQDRGRHRIEIYDGRTGRRVLSSRVGSSVDQLAVSHGAVVFSERTAIRVLRAPRWTPVLLAKASGTPFDLSIEGNRVVWGENRPNRGIGRIRAIELR